MTIWLDRVVILRGMKKQIKSFKSAFRGFCFAVKSESHMRFHLVATFYVFVFGCFYDFSAAKWALLAVLCALIIALEMINTCVEKLCDLFCDRYDFSVKIIKDIAAAAVLAVSFSAVFTAVLFFLDFEVIGKIFLYFVNNPVMLVLLILSAVISAVFVCAGPVKIKNAFLGIKRKDKR